MTKLPCEETLEDVCERVQAGHTSWVALKPYPNVAIVNFAYLRELEKQERHLASSPSRAAGACLDWASCDEATSECFSRFFCFKPPPP